MRLKADGSFTYTPDSDFVGTDSFTYRAGGGVAESNIATVTINIKAIAAAGMSPWVWAAPCLALGLLGGVLFLYWRRRSKRVASPASVPAHETSMQGNKKEWKDERAGDWRHNGAIDSDSAAAPEAKVQMQEKKPRRRTSEDCW